MPASLSDIYTREWFRARQGYRSAQHRLIEAAVEVFAPEGVVDIGCGHGYVVEYLLSRCPVMGVEGSRAAFEFMTPEVRRVVHLADLARDPVLPQVADYEFCVSFEVAEHIAPEHEARFLRWCTRGRRLLMSAAPPGQGGNHHVNERSREHWIAALALRGWQYSCVATVAWQDAAVARTRGCPWGVRNAMFFQQRPAFAAEAAASAE